MKVEATPVDDSSRTEEYQTQSKSSYSFNRDVVDGVTDSIMVDEKVRTHNGARSNSRSDREEDFFFGLASTY